MKRSYSEFGNTLNISLNFLLPIGLILISISLWSCRHHQTSTNSVGEEVTVDQTKSTAQSADGQYISWHEHLIDSHEISGVDISGSDGLVMADLDSDGFEDIISVHESDTKYDGVSRGHIRIAYGSADPDQWELITLAKGEEAGAAEDVTVDDINGDGHLDIVAACELAHLIYFQNPGVNIRTRHWERIIPKITKNRGSYIRVFSVDFNGDGRFEIIAANKGSQNTGGIKGVTPKPISYFEIAGDPLVDESWIEHELINVLVPINSQPIDIDSDGDTDVIIGSRGEKRIILLENISTDSIRFLTHQIRVKGSAFSDEYELQLNDVPGGITGFNMDYVDLSGDGKLDIVLSESFKYLVWLEQPPDWSEEWTLHIIGGFGPDQLVGLLSADINDDGYVDFISGGYSRGSRDKDGAVSINDPLGRLAWFENPKVPSAPWIRHDISRRKRGMFDKFIKRDLDGDGDYDFVSTRGNSHPYDGVFWLEQVRTDLPTNSFTRAREIDSKEMPLATLKH